MRNSKSVSLVCSASDTVVQDISYTDLFNGDFCCGDCGFRMKLPETTTHKNRVAQVVRHNVPASVLEFRQSLEKQTSERSRRDERA